MSLSISPSTDYDLICSVVTHHEVYPRLIDDFSPPADQYQPNENPALLYLVARDGTELLGLWMFAPENGVCSQVHTALLPTCRGKRAVHAVRAMLAWVWQNTGCERIVTNVPADNPSALVFAKWAGMKVIGVNEKSFQRNGKLLDQTILGLSRPTK